MKMVFVHYMYCECLFQERASTSYMKTVVHETGIFKIFLPAALKSQDQISNLRMSIKKN